MMANNAGIGPSQPPQAAMGAAIGGGRPNFSGMQGPSLGGPGVQQRQQQMQRPFSSAGPFSGAGPGRRVGQPNFSAMMGQRPRPGMMGPRPGIGPINTIPGGPNGAEGNQMPRPNFGAIGGMEMMQMPQRPQWQSSLPPLDQMQGQMQQKPPDFYGPQGAMDAMKPMKESDMGQNPHMQPQSGIGPSQPPMYQSQVMPMPQQQQQDLMNYYNQGMSRGNDMSWMGQQFPQYAQMMRR